MGKNATVLGWGMINDDGVYAESLRGVEVNHNRTDLILSRDHINSMVFRSSNPLDENKP